MSDDAPKAPSVLELRAQLRSCISEILANFKFDNPTAQARADIIRRLTESHERLDPIFNESGDPALSTPID